MTVIQDRPVTHRSATQLSGSAAADTSPALGTTIAPDASTAPVALATPAAPTVGSDHPMAFPRRSSEHAPNLATLAQLRSRGRNPLLTATSRRSRPATRGGCTG